MIANMATSDNNKPKTIPGTQIGLVFSNRGIYGLLSGLECSAMK